GPERVLRVLAALRPLDVIGPVALGEVRDVLAAELTTLAEPPPKDRYGRVFVGTIEQARGRSFEIVFLPGLAERIFPQKPREDPILLDALRRDLGAGLATQDERGRRERLLLRLAAGAARPLRTRWARWRGRFTPADGLVRVSAGTQETLAAARLGARAYSASALQKFAACPYQFFLSAICRLEPRPEVAPVVELDPATRG